MASGFLDAASGEPLHPAAAQVLGDAMEQGWADPSRLYHGARRSRQLLDNAREVIAWAVGARPEEVFFPASGTQAIHLGVLGMLAGRRRTGSRLTVSAVEHSSVLQAGRSHRQSGGELRTVPVDRDGRVDPAQFAAAADGAALACLQSANHEVGTLQPLDEVLARLADSAAGERPVPLLVDAAQSVGRVPIPSGWAALVGSAHKWGGPAGVGVLAIRRGTPFRSVLPVDERGWGLVPGYENVPAVVAAATALQARAAEAAALATEHSRLVDLIRTEIPRRVSDVQVIGPATDRLPHLVTFSCLYVEGEAVLTELDKAGFSVSSGSSCTASTLRPSHVLQAMGVLSHGNIRVSLSRDSTEADVLAFLEAVPDVVGRVRSMLGADGL